MARLREPEPDAAAALDEWADVDRELLEEAQRSWWWEYRRAITPGTDPRAWMSSHPYPGSRGRHYAHLRAPASWQEAG